jgi:hypothetical protein
MALKGDRHVIEDDISMTCETAASRGVGLVLKTSGSGVALGDRRNKAELIANPSGKVFVGILMNDVVDVDTTRYHLNFHKDEMKKGEPCTLMRKGWVITDKVTGTPTVGATAYLTTNGVFTPTVSSDGGTAATPKAGRFESIKDEDGYVKISVNVPQI